MLQVKVSVFQDGEHVQRGTLTLKDGEIKCEPPGDKVLLTLESSPVAVPDNQKRDPKDRMVFAYDNPERFLRLLPLEHRNGYLVCELVEQ